MENTIQAFLRAGSFSAAKPLIDKEMSDNPENPVVWRLLVRYESLQGNHKTALGLLDKALQIAPNDRELRQLELSIYFFLGERRVFQRKIDAFERGFLPDADTIFMRGMYEVEWGNIKIAKLMLAKLHLLNGRQEMISQLQVLIYKRRSDWIGIRRTLKKRTEANPTDEVNHGQIAWAEFNLLRFASARRSARQAMSLSGDKRKYSVLIFFSYLAYFPPFFLAHGYWFLMGLIIRLFERGNGDVILYFFGLQAYALLGLLCLKLFLWLGIPIATPPLMGFFILFFVWIPFPPLILSISQLFSRGKPTVTLVGY